MQPAKFSRPRPAQPRAVFLVGFMGAGKTSVGRVLAALLGWRFVDLDDRIVQREGRSVPEIFEHSGEAAFRRAESAALRELLAELNVPAVIALGGGAFVQAENASLLQGTGTPVIFLDAPAEVLLQRCLPQGSERPLLRDPASFRDLYEQRRPHYLRAAWRVDTAGKPVESVATEIMSALGLTAERV
jgi:shikimate kinase